MSPISNSALILISRRFLQASDIDAFNGIPKPNSLSPAAAARRAPLDPNPTFDSSMALTILVLLTALFFLGFFSIYIRRFASASAAAVDAAPPPAASSKGGGGGLDSSAVDSLPLVAYGGGAKHRMIDECPICLSDLSEGETVKLIPHCGHVFHPSCIDTWLASHVTCPLCRSADLFEICVDVTPDITDSRAPQINGERSCHAGGRTPCTPSNHAVLRRSTSF